jgi:hypothetical protein
VGSAWLLPPPVTRLLLQALGLDPEDNLEAILTYQLILDVSGNIPFVSVQATWESSSTKLVPSLRLSRLHLDVHVPL